MTRKGKSNSADCSEKESLGLVNLRRFVRCFVEKMFGYAVESNVAASLYVWFGRFRGVLDFRVQIVSPELLDSEIVEDGEDECEVRDEVEGDFTISISRA